MADDADTFVDLACLTYSDEESRARRDQAAAMLASTPDLVERSVYAAAAAGDVDAVRAHLDRDPACVGRRGTARGWEPLLALCYSRVAQRDALGTLELLLARGADPNGHVMLDVCRFTALTGAMGEGEAGPVEQPPHPEARALAERLLDAGADANESQGLYNTHFRPSNAWLELLFARGLASADDLQLLLGRAVVQGFVERVRLLLAHGAAADGRDRYSRRTHLENALLDGQTEIAQMLTAAGAVPPVLSERDRFRVAVMSNDATEATRLAGASPGPDALIAAARVGRLDALELALSLGLPIDGRDHCGETALHHAARHGSIDVVKALVERGASLDVRDPRFNGTPLGHARHFAERWPSAGVAEVVAFLEARGG